MPEPFLFEIGVEELPASYVDISVDYFQGAIGTLFGEHHISHGEVFGYGTPRRVVFFIDAVAEKGDDSEKTVIGPSVKAGIDPSGGYTKAALGFAKANIADPATLTIVDTEKGKYIALKLSREGAVTAELLAEHLPKIVAKLPFPKSMRWAGYDMSFGRPVQWICALLGTKVIPFTFNNATSSNLSHGHRFLAGNKSIELISADFEDYKKKLKDAFVIVDRQERKVSIELGIKEKLKEYPNLVCCNFNELIDEVVNLVEWPVILVGQFDVEFLKLPQELLIMTMAKNQKYFALADRDDNRLLANKFIITANNVGNAGEIIRGNERVIRARLLDAKFYFEEDRKIPFSTRVELLKTMVFSKKLGTMFEKTERIIKLASTIADVLHLARDKRETISTAAKLGKADLTTGLVHEFPELQGIAGRYYAFDEYSHNPSILMTIEEHYLPRTAGSDLPSCDEGAVLAIADRLDTIAGYFSIGQVPTGSADPYGLRRAIIGIIAIIEKFDYSLQLAALIDTSLAAFKSDDAAIRGSMIEFARQRFSNLYSEKYPQDHVEAVLAATPDDLDICDALDRIEALGNVELPESTILTFKRIANITKDIHYRTLDRSLFVDDSEKALSVALDSLGKDLEGFEAAKDYRSFLSSLTKLDGPVTTFFDSVLVMDPDERIRNNRLSLLAEIKATYSRLYDFTKLMN